jgi:23S rRNA pseudouridine2457 synthase
MTNNPNRYFIINKPYKMVSQFVSPDNVRLLGDLEFDFPELILTTNKKVTVLLFQSEKPHKRKYLVQVEKVVNEERLNQLRTGIKIRVKGGGDYITTPCEVEIVEKPKDLYKRNHEFREDLPHTWLTITLTEGKYHQIRKMVSAVHHHCKRLIRISIEDLEIEDLQPGKVKEIEEETFFKKLKIDNWKD